MENNYRVSWRNVSESRVPRKVAMKVEILRFPDKDGYIFRVYKPELLSIGSRTVLISVGKSAFDLMEYWRDHRDSITEMTNEGAVVELRFWA